MDRTLDSDSSNEGSSPSSPAIQEALANVRDAEAALHNAHLAALAAFRREIEALEMAVVKGLEKVGQTGC